MQTIDGYVCVAFTRATPGYPSIKLLFGPPIHEDLRVENMRSNGLQPYADVAAAVEGATILKRREYFKSVFVTRMMMTIADQKDDLRALYRKTVSHRHKLPLGLESIVRNKSIVIIGYNDDMEDARIIGRRDARNRYESETGTPFTEWCFAPIPDLDEALYTASEVGRRGALRVALADFSLGGLRVRV
jgi:hypothetical protein